MFTSRKPTHTKLDINTTQHQVLDPYVQVTKRINEDKVSSSIENTGRIFPILETTKSINSKTFSFKIPTYAIVASFMFRALNA